jgi:hypothetical protein
MGDKGKDHVARAARVGVVIPYGPGIVGRDNIYGVQAVESACTDRTWYIVPLRADPMHSEGCRAIRSVVIANSPQVVRRGGIYPIQYIV